MVMDWAVNSSSKYRVSISDVTWGLKGGAGQQGLGFRAEGAGEADLLQEDQLEEALMVLAVEGQPAAHHLVHDHAQAPPVHGPAIIVLWCPTEGLHGGSIGNAFLAQPKVHHIPRVEILQGRNNLSPVEAGTLLREDAFSREVEEQLEGKQPGQGVAGHQAQQLQGRDPWRTPTSPPLAYSITKQRRSLNLHGIIAPCGLFPYEDDLPKSALSQEFQVVETVTGGATLVIHPVFLFRRLGL
ncbi:hypothetical protein E2320_000909 [Naja naja]|nr:hypothetical protein E2320_000909 [Naja naja]